MDSKVTDSRTEYWFSQLEAQAKSGLSKRIWCEQNGIQRGQFFRWQKVYREYILNGRDIPLPETGKSSVFVEIPCEKTSEIKGASVSDAVNGAASSSIRIEYGGFSITLAGDVDEKKLETVIKVIAHAE